MIYYLVPEFFLNADHSKPYNAQNPGGGIRTKLWSVEKACVGNLDFLVLDNIVERSLDLTHEDVLLVEPFAFRNPDLTQEIYISFVMDHIVAYVRDFPGKTVLYTSELEVLRWTGSMQQSIIPIFDAITYNCQYQKNIWEALNFPNLHLLCDPIDDALFRPDAKNFSVIATGLTSPGKNITSIVELYDRLRTESIETIYIGGADLWGTPQMEYSELEYEVSLVAKRHIRSLPPHQFAVELSKAGFVAGTTIHDVFCSGHAEALMSGCISIGGGHPLYRERPGFVVAPDTESLYNKLKDLTCDFTKLPPVELNANSRGWCERNISYSAFRRQIDAILSELNRSTLWT